MAIIMLSLISLSMAAPASPQTNDYYLTRGWGESSLPFAVIYSDYGRTKLQQELAASKLTTTPYTTHTETATKKPEIDKRQKMSTKKNNGLTQLFVSKGWGPMGK